MEPKTSINRPATSPWALRRRSVVPLYFLLLLNRAQAQSVLTPVPLTPTTPTAVQEYQMNNPMQVFAAPEEIPSPIPLQWGLATAHPHLDYQFLYGNGIQSSPSHSQNTIVQKLSPGILLNLGTHWTLDYTPVLNFYSSRNFQDTVNQSVLLNWGTTYGNDWSFSGSQSYAYTGDPDIETAAQTDREAYSTALNTSWQINSKMSLDAGLNQNLNYVGNGGNSTNNFSRLPLADSKSWSTLEWLNYQFWPRFNAGLGVGLGYNQQTDSADSIYQQYQCRVNWRATDKISFLLSGGVHDQEYLSGGAESLVTPIFGATIQYLPFEQTEISVGANRTVSSSAFQSQVTENTSISIDLNQRLFGKLHVDLSGRYGTTKYVASATDLSTSRSDDTYSFNARLSCPLLKRGTVSVFYTYTDNSSSQSGFAAAGNAYGFSSNQVGIEFSYRY